MTKARVRSPGASPFVTASAARAPHVSVRRVQPSERGFESGRLAVEVDGDARHLLLEQALPCAAPAHRLLGEDDLFRLGQQVRPVAALRLEVMAGEREPLVRQQRFDLFVGELGPFEVEEQQLGTDDRGTFLDALHTRRRGRDRSVSVAKSSPA